MAQHVEKHRGGGSIARGTKQLFRHARGLQRLAAARTRASALTALESSLRPYLLPVGTQRRVSYSVSSTARGQLKVQPVKARSPQYTRELNTVTALHRAPGRREPWLYDLDMAAARP